MIRRLGCVVMLGLFGLAFAAPASWAHPFGPPPTARVTAAGQTITIDWVATPDDAVAIGERLGLMPEGSVAAYRQDSAAQVAPSGADEARLSASPELRAYLAERVTATQGGVPCRTRVPAIPNFVHEGARIRVQCPDPVAEATLRITLLHDIHDAYRTVATGTRTEPAQSVFTTTAPEHTWRFGVEAGGGAPPELNRFDAAFVRLVDQALASPAFLLAAVGAAFAVGAFHALAPGHGKAVTAAYLVGGRGRGRDALLLGLAVAAMHTVSVVVLALGLQAWLRRSGAVPNGVAGVTPGLRVASGVLVLGLGVVLLARQARERRRPHTHELPPEAEPFSRRGLALLGVSGGLLPSPAAFLVLVTASLSGQLLFGLVLVGVFSVGLATTLTLIALAVVRGRAAVADRMGDAVHARWSRRAAVVAAGVIVAGGAVLTTAGVLAL